MHDEGDTGRARAVTKATRRGASRPRRNLKPAGAPPPLPASPAIRTTDLYGRTADGRLELWDRARPVLPVTAFERDGPWIKSGHYVIDHEGDAVTVHCGNMTDGSVSVQFMCAALRSSRSVPRNEIEPLLLGRVVVTAEDRETNRKFIEVLRQWVNRMEED